MGVNKIIKELGEVELQFYVPSEFTQIGYSTINLAWGVFPDTENDDSSHSRSGEEELSIYIPYSFYELYDMTFSFWLGIAVFIFGQFFGVTFPILIILTSVLFVYDLIKMIECIDYVINVSPESNQIHEFTWLKFAYYPLKRFLTNIFFFEIPIIITSALKLIITIISGGGILSYFQSRFNWETW